MSKARVCKYCGRYMPPGVKCCEHCGGRAHSYAWVWTTLVCLALVAGATLYVVHAINKQEEKAATVISVTPDFASRINYYQQLTPFSEDLAAVCDGSRWGYINTDGHLVIPCRYDHAAPFNGGVAQVKIGRRLAYIDVSGKEVDGGMRKTNSPMDARYRVFAEGGPSGKVGIMDADGNIVVPAMFDSLTYVSEGLAVAVVYTHRLRGTDIDVELDAPLPSISEENLENQVSFMTNSAIRANTVRDCAFGYVDLAGNYTFSRDVLDKAAASGKRFRMFAERQVALQKLENERLERLRVRREQQLADSIDAVIAAVI